MNEDRKYRVTQVREVEIIAPSAAAARLLARPILDGPTPNKLEIREVSLKTEKIGR